MNQHKVISSSSQPIKLPGLAKLFTLLLILSGVLNILNILPMLLFDGILAAGIFSIIGIAQIIIAMGIRRMKPWSFHALTGLILLSILSFVAMCIDGGVNISNSGLFLVQMIFFIYLRNVSKQFLPEISSEELIQQSSPESVTKIERSNIKKDYIIIFIVLTIIFLAVFWAQKFLLQEESDEIIPEEEASSENHEDWNAYRNDEHGFIFGYRGDRGVYTDIIEKPNTLTGLKSLFYVSFGETCTSYDEDVIEYVQEKGYMGEDYDWTKGVPVSLDQYSMKVHDNSENLPLDTWVRRYENCGYDDKGYLVLEKFSFEGIESLRTELVGTCATGASYMDYSAYIPQNKKVYQIFVLHEPMMGEKEAQDKCRIESKKIFDQMLSTLRFLE